jgi:hypothetical protein
MFEVLDRAHRGGSGGPLSRARGVTGTSRAREGRITECRAMGPMRAGRSAIRLPGGARLARVLRPGLGGRAKRPYPPAYAEDEVRDMIYGWHSGTVEPPQPADSARAEVGDRLRATQAEDRRTGDRSAVRDEPDHVQGAAAPRKDGET